MTATWINIEVWNFCVIPGIILPLRSKLVWSWDLRLAVHYVHPDKRPELWINEVGLTSRHRNRGLATRLLRALFEAGRKAGCDKAWVLSDRSNTAAMRLYTSLGGVEAPKDQVMFTFPLATKNCNETEVAERTSDL